MNGVDAVIGWESRAGVGVLEVTNGCVQNDVVRDIKVRRIRNDFVHFTIKRKGYFGLSIVLDGVLMPCRRPVSWQ